MKKQMKKNPKKETTIDDLAIMVAKGFSSMQEYMDKRFDGVDIRFDKVEERLDRVEERLDKVEDRLDKIEGHHSRRLDNVEDKVVVIKNVIEKDLKVKVSF